MRKLCLFVTVLALLTMPVLATADVTWLTARAGQVVVSDSLTASQDTTAVYAIRGFALGASTHNITGLTVQYTVANVDTNVVVALESSLDNSNWFNLDSDGNTTITSDGTYAFEVQGVSTKRYFRFRRVSEQGSGATVVVKWMFGGH